MPEKKRPAFSEKPLPRAVVWTHASSTDTESSGCTATKAAPRSHGSMLAANPISDSARLRPREPGPTSAPADSGRPAMAYFAGSCEVRV